MAAAKKRARKPAPARRRATKPSSTALLRRELAEARRQQAATADILKAISRSSFDLPAVLARLVKSAAKLCEADKAFIFRRDGALFRLAANHGFSRAFERYTLAHPIAPSRGTSTGRAVLERQAVHIPDVDADPEYTGTEFSRRGGFRTNLGVPLLRDGEVIGVFALTRQKVRPFTDRQIELVTTFADQAVIAIENARLFAEVQARTRSLGESLERQTATSEVLSVISRSTYQLQPVFDAIVRTASRLCEAEYALIFSLRDGRYHLVASNNATADLVRYATEHPIAPGRGSMIGRAALDKRAVHIPDCMADPEYELHEYQGVGKFRSMLGVPLLRDGEPIGVIGLLRSTVKPFTATQIELVTTFADQAVIAIENARLFAEVQARTDDLAESLQQQTATADVLKAISRSSFDLPAVLGVLVKSAAELCEADKAFIYRRDGALFRLAANHGFSREFEQYALEHPIPPTRGTVTGRAALERRAVHIPDVEADPEYTGTDFRQRGGFRTNLGVPLLRDGEVIGVFALTRQKARPFTDRQIELVTTFADQAVIAIENARLFAEVQARTRDVTEALERQAATSEVLNVISRSTYRIQPVFDAIVTTAARLCRADWAVIRKLGPDGKHHIAAHYCGQPEFIDYVSRMPIVAGRGSAASRALLERRTVHIPDVADDEEYTWSAAAAIGRFRAVLSVPLLREGQAIGVISLVRTRAEPFAQQQIDLTTTFADQAVIAIENARLFNETKEALEQQKASAEILGVISQSVSDAQPVFEKILECCKNLFGGDELDVLLVDEQGMLRIAAYVGDYRAAVEATFPAPWEITPAARAIREKRVANYSDVLNNPDTPPVLRRVGKIAGYHSVAFAPMVWEGRGIGVVGVARSGVAFTDKELTILQGFADQAVIAIQNSRLFNETKEALEQQTATSKILQVIAASPTDIKPVLQEVAASACEVCDAYDGAVLLRQGDDLLFSAHHGPIPIGLDKWPINRNWTAGRAVVDRATVHVPDLRGPEGEAFPDGRELSIRMGHRCIVSVPLMREDEAIGAIVLRRKEPHPFSDKQIALLRTFADQSTIAINNVRLFEEVRERTRELSEALDQQTATSEVLGIISSSPSDLDPVFRTMLTNAMRICDAKFGVLFEYADGAFQALSTVGVPPEFDAFVREKRVWGPDTGMGMLARTRQVVHIDDVRGGRAFAERDPGRMASADLGGVRTVLIVPMLRDGELTGGISIFRQEVRPFNDKQIALVRAFAEQAIIAIANVRLLAELRARTEDLAESLKQQTATSKILGVISSSLTDTQPVFDAIVQSAVDLFPDAAITITLPVDGQVIPAAIAESDPARVEAWRRRFPFPLSREYMHSAAIIDRCEIDIPDATRAPERFAVGARNFLATGYCAATIMPMMRGERAIGAISVVRRASGPLSEKQRAILRTFADQAVIAIENVRLFKELRARTDDLGESLMQQTATADVLKVISRASFDLPAALKALVETAARLCEASQSVIYQRDGDVFRVVANHGFSPEFEAYLREHPTRPEPGTMSGRVAITRRTVHIPDALADPDYMSGRGYQARGGYRTMLGVPLLREGEVVGVFVLTRPVVKPFSERQVQLVTTFADQAMIAIENARLLAELRESLKQQTATADVLKVISRSTFDLNTVLRTLLETAVHLCEADQGTITRQKDGKFYRAEAVGFTPEFLAAVRDLPVVVDRSSTSGRALLEGRIVHIPDVKSDPEYAFAEALKLGGFRASLGVPMMKEGKPIGVIAFTRREPRPFTDKQIELVTTFADQAAIAIENARLFESVEAHARELAHSLEDLRSAQDRLVQTEKLASLGQLTAGIAHEIKNPLNFVNNFAALSGELVDELRQTIDGADLPAVVQEDVADLTQMLRGNLDKIVQHGKRADSIVKNMLLHSREGSGERRKVDVNALVEEGLNLAYHGARAEKRDFNVTLARELDPLAGEAELFPQEITRVLLNLIANGFYATMKRKAAAGDGYAPTLTARTRSLGERVEIAIRDNGTGIPPEVKARIFNPFFTTKPAGEGTGLGLSLSHDIVVKQHGGTLEVDTEPGAFTEFRLVLPRAAARSGESA